MKKYWLMKTEPSVYSIEDLKREKEALWDGVRNYQARNFMMREMKIGDSVLFYHSLASPPGAAGLAEVSSKALPDPTALDPASKYFDPKASPENRRWYCVKVRFKKMFKKVISIQALRKEPRLRSMQLLRPGQRLSIMPVTKKEFEQVVRMSNESS